MIFLPLSLSSSPVISSPSLPSDFYPTHHSRARAVLYPETLTARLSSQRPITTSGPSSWTPWASQHGPAWDAGAEGRFWWIRGPGRVIMALGLEGTGAEPRGCTCAWWRWWSTHLYSPVRWIATGCVPRASCASTPSPTKPWFWKSFSRTLKDATHLFPRTTRSVVMVTASTCWRSWRRTWASPLTSTLWATGSMGALRTVAGQDWWGICSAALPTWQWRRSALIQPEAKSSTSPLHSSLPAWEFWSVLLLLLLSHASSLLHFTAILSPLHLLYISLLYLLTAAFLRSLSLTSPQLSPLCMLVVSINMAAFYCCKSDLIGF